MKKIINCFLRYSVVFSILLIIFNLSLYAACLFSSDLLKKHAAESAEILKRQGERYELSTAFNVCNDNCNDSVIINELYSIDSREPYISYMKVRKNYNRDITQLEILDRNGNNISALYSESEHREVLEFAPIRELSDHLSGKIHLSFTYGRYWHGYIALFRPLLLLFNISQIRILLFSVYTVLLFYFLYLLHKRFGKITAIIFAASLVCTGYVTSSFSLASSPVFLTMMISAVILMKRIDKIQDFHLYIFAVACISSFVDILTVPMITLGMLSCLYLLKLIEDGRDWLFCLETAVFSTFVWFVGFGGTWLCKWVLYDLTVSSGNSVMLPALVRGELTLRHADDFSMLALALKQIFFRVSRTNDGAGIDSDKYIYITLNILGRASLYTMITSGIILYARKFKSSIDGFNKNALSFLFIACLPAVWYTALANHTELHYFFTYRLSFVYMLAMLLAINEILFSGNLLPSAIRTDHQSSAAVPTAHESGSSTPVKMN